MSVIFRSDGFEARFTFDVVWAIVSSRDKCINPPRATPPKALFLIKSRLLCSLMFFIISFISSGLSVFKISIQGARRKTQDARHKAQDARHKTQGPWFTPHASPVPFPEIVIKFSFCHRQFPGVIIKPVHEVFFYFIAPLAVDLSRLILPFAKTEVTEFITQCSYF